MNTTDNTSQPTTAPAFQPTPEIVQGVKVLKTGVARDFTAIQGKDCFANLKDFDLVGLGAVSAAVDRLPLAESVAIKAADGRGDFASFQAIRNATTGQPWAVMKEGYSIIQPAEAFHPFLEAAQEAGLHLLASLEATHDGARINGRALIMNPEATFTALQDSSDPIMLGLRFKTSHDGSAAFRVQPFAVRVVCLNDNTWGSWLESVAIRHDRQAGQKVADLKAYLGGLLDTVPTIKALIQEAAAVKVAPQDFALAALGAGMAPRQVANWTAPGLAAWEPDPVGGPTLWSAYNSLTAYLTHGVKAGGLGTESQEAALDLAAGLLDAKALPALIQKGRDLVANLQKGRDAKVAAQGQGAKVRLTIPAIPLVGLK